MLKKLQSEHRILMTIALGLGLSWLYALCSQIVLWLPFMPVPLSIQPLPLYLSVLILGWPAVTAYGFYMAQGAMGLPFFAGGMGGMARLLGPTGGYLMGFGLSMILLASLRPFLRSRSGWYTLAAALTAEGMAIGCGLVQLAFFVGTQNVLAAGLYPFMLGDFILKPMMLTIVVRLLRR